MLNLSAPSFELAHLCERYRIHKLSVFGSVLRDDFRPNSDVDVLIEFERGQTPDFFTLYEIETALSDYFDGRTLDIVTLPALNPHLREPVLASAKVMYEQG